MIDWFVNILHKYPESAVFLAVGIGFIVGKIKIGFFSLGTVASALIAGLLIGQLGIDVPGPMKSAFFLLFLFTTGYSVGPQFFRSVASHGVKQVLFALLICTACFASVFIMAKIAGYNVGQAGGMFAGSQTISGALGIVPETINSNPLISEELKKELIAAVPVCYSITYIFGAAGSAFILSIIGPRILGGIKKVRQEVKEIESSMGDLVKKIFMAPGNIGMESLGTLVDISEEKIEELADFAQKNKIDLTIVGPESVLALGIVNEFERRGLKIFGPTKEAAKIESSKEFAKKLMKKYDVPTGAYETFTNLELAVK